MEPLLKGPFMRTRFSIYACGILLITGCSGTYDFSVTLYNGETPCGNMQREFAVTYSNTANQTVTRSAKAALGQTATINIDDALTNSYDVVGFAIVAVDVSCTPTNPSYVETNVAGMKLGDTLAFKVDDHGQVTYEVIHSEAVQSQVISAAKGAIGLGGASKSGESKNAGSSSSGDASNSRGEKSQPRTPSRR